MRNWIKSQYPGVRYRLHPSRRYGAGPDKYITIFYKLDGKMVQESLGWASKTWEDNGPDGVKIKCGWTEKRAAGLLAELQDNHRRHSGPRTFKEMKELNERQRRIEQQAVLDLERKLVTFTEFWNSDYVHHLKRRVCQTSASTEQIHFEKWLEPFLSNIPMVQIIEQNLEKIQDQMINAKKTRRYQQYVIGTFGRVWKHAAQRGLVDRARINPAKLITIGKINNERTRIVSPEEAKRILDALEERDRHAYDLTFFCLMTGCRLSEAASLRWDYVDIHSGRATFVGTKNASNRIIYLVPEVIDILRVRGQYANGEYVFTNSNGKRWWRKDDRAETPSVFRAVVNDLGLNEGRNKLDRICFHSLRHTAATMVQRNGTSVKDMQLIFGWKTPTMVFRYAKGSEDTQRNAMAGLASSLVNQGS